jgi:hypothetical protein
MIHSFHVYECQDCTVVFAVEDSDEIDHSQTCCPICTGEDLEDKGHGEMEVVPNVSS